MSYYPCEAHGRRINGALESLRVTILQSGHRFSRRLRLCPDCLDKLFVAHISNIPSISDEQIPPEDSLCPSCSGSLDGLGNRPLVAAYVYRLHAEPDERVAHYCLECATNLCGELGLREES